MTISTFPALQSSEHRVVARALTIPDACLYLGGVHRSTVYRLAAAGRLKLRKIAGRTVILRDDLDRLLEVDAPE